MAPSPPDTCPSHTHAAPHCSQPRSSLHRDQGFPTNFEKTWGPCPFSKPTPSLQNSLPLFFQYPLFFLQNPLPPCTTSMFFVQPPSSFYNLLPCCIISFLFTQPPLSLYKELLLYTTLSLTSKLFHYKFF
jgi:hypothetical protein